MTTPWNTHVICFQKYRSAHTSQSPIHRKHCTHHILWQKITYQKQPKRGPSHRHTRPARGNVSRELSTPQGERASPRHMPQKHLKSLTGPTTYATKNNTKTYHKSPRQSPNCQTLRALNCCACLFTSLSNTYVPNSSTNNPTPSKKILTHCSYRICGSDIRDCGKQHK